LTYRDLLINLVAVSMNSVWVVSTDCCCSKWTASDPIREECRVFQM